jgi:hypothetical protein
MLAAPMSPDENKMNLALRSGGRNPLFRGHAINGIGILCMLLFFLCGCVRHDVLVSSSNCPASFTFSTQGADCWPNGLTLAGQSGDVKVTQGYASSKPATGVAGDYFFETSALYLSTNYNSLDATVSNSRLNVPGTNHMGDGDYYNGKVYGVIENWNGCATSSAPVFIAVFDGATLQIDQTIEVTAYQSEASGITIDADTNEAIVSDYCDSSKLYAYNMSTWTFSRTIPLATSADWIQGVAYRHGFVYIATTNGLLYGLRLSDNSMRLLLTATMSGEYEGIDANTDELRWLVNRTDGTHVLYRYSTY